MIIKPGTTYSFTVERSFHISKAVYDFSSPYSASTHVTTLMVDCGDKKGIILCHLKNDYNDKLLKPEANLDIHFRVGQELKLYTVVSEPGKDYPKYPPPTPIIHLSGYEFVN
jgi:hypothetical protein